MAFRDERRALQFERYLKTGSDRRHQSRAAVGAR